MHSAEAKAKEAAGKRTQQQQKEEETYRADVEKKLVKAGYSRDILNSVIENHTMKIVAFYPGEAGTEMPVSLSSENNSVFNAMYRSWRTLISDISSESRDSFPLDSFWKEVRGVADDRYGEPETCKVEEFNTKSKIQNDAVLSDIRRRLLPYISENNQRVLMDWYSDTMKHARREDQPSTRRYPCFMITKGDSDKVIFLLLCINIEKVKQGTWKIVRVRYCMSLYNTIDAPTMLLE